MLGSVTYQGGREFIKNHTKCVKTKWEQMRIIILVPDRVMQTSGRKPNAFADILGND